MSIDVNDLKQKLHNGIVNVKFTKVNGEVREMPCTLMEDLIPSTDLPKGVGKQKAESVLSVYCTDKAAWRSFRVDSVISY